MKVLVTGATGYVGLHACQRFTSLGWGVRALCRDEAQPLPAGVERFVSGDLTAFTQWPAALDGCDLVIHCAGLAHIAKWQADQYDPTAYSRINRDVVLSLAEAAKTVGLPRLIFLSSVAAYGDVPQDVSAVETMQQRPVDPYGLSKREAEEGMAAILDGTEVQYLMLRPPMIYGEHCPGNFGRLAQLVKTRLPLPLGSLKSEKSLLALDNLLDFLAHVATHSHTGSGVFNIADDETVSLAEIVTLIGLGMKKPALLLPLPVPVLQLAARLVGRRDMLDKLATSLTLDCSLTKDTFDWRSPMSPATAIPAAAASFL